MSRAKTHQVAGLEIIFTGFMIIIGTILPLLLYKRHTADTQIPIWGLEILAMLGLGLQFLIYLTSSSRRPLKAYLLVAISLSTLLLVLALS